MSNKKKRKDVVSKNNLLVNSYIKPNKPISSLNIIAEKSRFKLFINNLLE